MAGIILLSAALFVLVASDAAPLVLALFPQGASHNVSLVEQRVIDAEAAMKPLPQGAKRRVVAMDAPPQGASAMAAQLDAAERTEVASSPRRPRQRLAFGDGISFPSPPRMTSVKTRERHRRRPAYADLRGRRFDA